MNNHLTRDECLSLKTLCQNALTDLKFIKGLNLMIVCDDTDLIVTKKVAEINMILAKLTKQIEVLT